MRRSLLRIVGLLADLVAAMPRFNRRDAGGFAEVLAPVPAKRVLIGRRGDWSRARAPHQCPSTSRGQSATCKSRIRLMGRKCVWRENTAYAAWSLTLHRANKAASLQSGSPTPGKVVPTARRVRAPSKT